MPHVACPAHQCSRSDEADANACAAASDRYPQPQLEKAGLRMKRALITSVFATVLLTPTLVFAQENGDTGITMGYPASIGLIWHASDKVAIRPEFAFSYNSSESDSDFSRIEGSGNTVGVGASVLFYLRKWDRIQTYASPRYSYSRSRTESESSTGGESESTTNSHSFAGYFGAQYSPHQRFSIFGEVGAGVTRSTGRLNDGLSESSSTTVSTRTGVGVIFYF
jgi:hypothetical protein